MVTAVFLESLVGGQGILPEWIAEIQWFETQFFLEKLVSLDYLQIIINRGKVSHVRMSKGVSAETDKPALVHLADHVPGEIILIHTDLAHGQEDIVPDSERLHEIEDERVIGLPAIIEGDNDFLLPESEVPRLLQIVKAQGLKTIRRDVFHVGMENVDVRPHESLTFTGDDVVVVNDIAILVLPHEQTTQGWNDIAENKPFGSVHTYRQ